MKRIFIIVVAIAVVIATGVTLYLNNIQIQTPSPQVALPAPVAPAPVSPPPPPPAVTPEPEEPQVVPPVVETPKPVETPPPADPAPEPDIKPEPIIIPEDFIVDKEFWQNAFIIKRPDGLDGPRGVGFSDIPIGTEIRAPMSGYVYIHTARWEDKEAVEIVISEHKYDSVITGSNRRFFFLANDFDPIATGDKIQKGEAFLSIRNMDEDKREVFPGFFDRKTIFAMGFKGDWNTDLTIEDPREFLWVPMQQKVVGEDK